jgi:hypothetical protein
MQRFALLLLSFVLVFSSVHAQDDLFGPQGNGTPKKTTHEGFVFGVNADYDRPGGDMAARFGGNFRVGGSFMYKTKSNWMIGGKGDFIFGDQVKQDSLMANIRDVDGGFINQNGERVNIITYERGYMVGLQAGKIFTFSKQPTDNGMLVMTGVGFIQHRIRIFDKDGNIYQVKGDYVKGYDRLANGIYVEQYIGYNHFAANELMNYHIGFDFVAGFTQGRRDFLYDVMLPGNDKRLDVLFGIRAGWYIPVFHRKSEDYYFN